MPRLRIKTLVAPRRDEANSNGKPPVSRGGLYWLKTRAKLNFNLRLSALIPYSLIAILFIIVPFVLLIKNAATPYSGVGSVNQIMVENNFWEVLGESVWLGLLAAFASLFIIFPFVWIVARSNSKNFRLVALVLLLSPLLVFTIAKVFALKGLLLSIFDEATFNNIGVRLIGMVYLYSPFMVVPLYSVLSTLPKSLLDASADLGQGAIKTIFRVVLPYAMKGIFAGLALVFMLAATNLVISQNLLVGGAIAPRGAANNIDVRAANVASAGKELDRISASTMSLITIAIMIAVYAIITYTPLIIRKIRGGVNV